MPFLRLEIRESKYSNVSFHNLKLGAKHAQTKKKRSSMLSKPVFKPKSVLLNPDSRQHHVVVKKVGNRVFRLIKPQPKTP